jgi:hypothetical protein
MSVAICLTCGSFKPNAFAICPECGARPRGVEALARQILLTDMFATRPLAMHAELAEKVKLSIATGEPLLFSEEALEAARASARQAMPDLPQEFHDATPQ